MWRGHAGTWWWRATRFVTAARGGEVATPWGWCWPAPRPPRRWPRPRWGWSGCRAWWACWRAAGSCTLAWCPQPVRWTIRMLILRMSVMSLWVPVGRLEQDRGAGADHLLGPAGLGLGGRGQGHAAQAHQARPGAGGRATHLPGQRGHQQPRRHLGSVEVTARRQY